MYNYEKGNQINKKGDWLSVTQGFMQSSDRLYEKVDPVSFLASDDFEHYDAGIDQVMLWRKKIKLYLITQFHIMPVSFM